MTNIIPQSTVENRRLSATFLYGANQKIVGKCKPEQLSYSGAFVPAKGTMSDLAKHIGKGHPWMPALLNGNKKRWQSNANYAEVLGADIDAGMTIAEALQNPFISRYCGLGIESASSKPDHNKFRLVFRLATPIEGWENIRIANRYLLELLKVADPACKDASRFFFGAPGRSPFLLNEDARLPDDFLEQALAWHDKQERIAQAEYTAAVARRKELLDRFGDDAKLELVREALDFIPPRNPGSGNYPDCLRVLAALTHEFGESVAIQLAESWSPSIPGTTWDIPYKARSLSKSRSKRPATLGSLFSLAKQHGFKFPQRTIAPKILPEDRIADRLSKRLKRKPDIRLKIADLSAAQLKALPERGIIALGSGKGTGKTKYIAAQVRGEGATLAFTHLRSLTQNLCYRLGLNYRNDLDKIGGRFVSREGYTLRVGSCIQALLAIDPDKFEGCDLVVDEVAQVLKSLLTSSTCNREGSRALLLERFRRLIQVAKRVIIADADLDDRTLDYLEALRGDGSRAFLIRNDYQAKGYTVEVDQSPTKDAIVGRLLRVVKEDLGSRKPHIIFTDSYRFSKTLARLTEGLGARVLLINRDTSSGEAEQAFITKPDEVVERGEYDAIICSPSLTTGVSIESQGKIAAVWGVFQGASLEDSDLAQMLARVRDPKVRRYVWVAERGRFFSKVEQTTNPLEIKGALYDRTRSVVVAQFQNGLAFPVGNNLDRYDFAGNPHLNYWASTIADRNFSAWNLRAALVARLKLEGHQVTIVQGEADRAIRNLLTETRQAIKQSDAAAIVNAENLNLERYLTLKDKDGLTVGERLAVQKFEISDFYCVPVGQVNLELVLFDFEGRLRGELSALEDLIYGTAAARVAAGIEKQINQGGITPWDLSTAELKRSLRAELGLEKFLDPDKQWVAGDAIVSETADRIRENAGRVKSVLNFSVKAEISDLQLIHQLLRQLGVKATSTRCRVKGKKSPPRVYTLDKSHWEKVTAILERRAAHRWANSVSDPPPISSDYKKGGGSAKIPDLERVPLKELARYSISDLQELASWLEQGIVKEQHYPPAIVQLARSWYRAA